MEKRFCICPKPGHEFPCPKTGTEFPCPKTGTEFPTSFHSLFLCSMS